MAHILNPLFKHIILTEASATACPASELKKYFKNAEIKKISEIDFKKLSGNILICGSFYLCSFFAF